MDLAAGRRVCTPTIDLLIEISELIEAVVQISRPFSLLVAHARARCEPAPPEMRHRITSPPRAGEATTIPLVRVSLDLGDARIYFAARPLTLNVAALVALFELKTLR
jgi:hypothetical protein